VRGTMIRSGNWGQDLLTFCFSWFSILTRRSSKWPSFMRLLSTWSGVTVGPRAVEPASPPDSCIFLNTFSNPYLPQVFLSLHRSPPPPLLLMMDQNSPKNSIQKENPKETSEDCLQQRIRPWLPTKSRLQSRRE
jgi:hypothetical protein